MFSSSLPAISLAIEDLSTKTKAIVMYRLDQRFVRWARGLVVKQVGTRRRRLLMLIKTCGWRRGSFDVADARASRSKSFYFGPTFSELEQEIEETQGPSLKWGMWRFFLGDGMLPNWGHES